MAYQVTRKYQLEALKKRGFGDLNQALLNVMVYPHQDGMRPSDLADRINMTKQATNYLLGQLEALGYIERRAQKGSSRRLVFLTRRGWQSIDLHRAAVLDVEAQWAKAVGKSVSRISKRRLNIWSHSIFQGAPTRPVARCLLSGEKRTRIQG